MKVLVDLLLLKHGVVFMELPLMITIERDLSARNSRPAQVRTVVHRESKVWAPKTVGDRLGLFIKAHSKGNLVLLMVRLVLKHFLKKFIYQHIKSACK